MIKPEFAVDDAIPGLNIVLLERIGEGGQAQVWRVKPMFGGGPELAVRISAIPSDLEGQAVHTAWRSRLERETAIWQDFDASLWVLALKHVLFEPKVDARNGQFDLYAQFMKYKPEKSLEHHIFEPDRTTLFTKIGRNNRVLVFLRNLAGGLQTGHAVGHVHGDLKPSNVLLHLDDNALHPALMDFGTAKSLDSIDGNFRPGFEGTPEYAAPEVLDGRSQHNGVSDIYSLGVVYWEILTGRRYVQPIIGQTGVTVLERIDNVRQQLAERRPLTTADIRQDTGIDEHKREQLAPLVNRMLQPDPNRRKTESLSKCRAVLADIIGPDYTDSATTAVTPIADRFRWARWVHDAFDSKPLYYILKSPRSFDDAVWIQERFQRYNIRGYSLYRLIGSYDHMIRVWVNEETAVRVERAVREYRFERGRQAHIEKVEVLEYELSTDRGVRNAQKLDRDGILQLIASCGSKSAEEQFDILKKDKLVTSMLVDDRISQTAIRVFMFMLCERGDVSAWRLKDAADRLREIVEQFSVRSKDPPRKASVKRLSVYQCRVQANPEAPWQSCVMLRFILGDYHAFSDIIAAISAQKEQFEKLLDSDIRTTSLFELDKRGLVESDDGNIVFDAQH